MAKRIGAPDAVQAPLGKRSKVVFWDKDVCAEAACMCGKSSIELLLEWLSYTDINGCYINFIRWKGGIKTKDAEKKATVAMSFVTSLQNVHGLHRAVDAVLAKMQELTTTFNAANDFLSHTGSGIIDALEERYDDKDDPAYLAQIHPIHIGGQMP